jgi:hypothetical protein
MVVALHMWFNFIIVGFICIVILILQIGFHVGASVFKTFVFIVCESILFFTWFIFVMSVRVIFNDDNVNFAA